jgi:zinc transporter, ZIP family
VKGVLALVFIAAATACSGGAEGSELGVTHATLMPGRIVLVLLNESQDPARVEQVILNDAFVDFRASRKDLSPGDTEAIVVLYPWIEGESYDLELLTSTGATVGYEIEEAEAA